MRTAIDDGDLDGDDWYVVKEPADPALHEQIRICRGNPKLGVGSEVAFGPAARDEVDAFVAASPYHLSDETTASEPPDSNESDRLSDQLKGQTHEHAKPPRLEDEGQSGG